MSEEMRENECRLQVLLKRTPNHAAYLAISHRRKCRCTW